MLFRPAESSKQIVDFYRNYLLTTFQTTDDKYNIIQGPLQNFSI